MCLCSVSTPHLVGKAACGLTCGCLAFDFGQQLDRPKRKSPASPAAQAKRSKGQGRGKKSTKKGGQRSTEVSQPSDGRRTSQRQALARSSKASGSTQGSDGSAAGSEGPAAQASEMDPGVHLINKPSRGWCYVYKGKLTAAAETRGMSVVKLLREEVLRLFTEEFPEEKRPITPPSPTLVCGGGSCKCCPTCVWLWASPPSVPMRWTSGCATPSASSGTVVTSCAST